MRIFENLKENKVFRIQPVQTHANSGDNLWMLAEAGGKERQKIVEEFVRRKL